MHFENKDKYKSLVPQVTGLPVFFQPWWLDLVCKEGQWDVAITEDKGGHPTAVFPYFRQKIKGLSVLSNPPLTPYLGVHLIYPENQTSRTSRYSFENKTMKGLLPQLPGNVSYMNFSFQPIFENWYPFYWSGFEQTVRYTYLLKLDEPSEQLFSNFSNTLKRQINKAAQTIKVQTSDNSETLYKFLRTNLAKQNMKTPINYGAFEKLYHAIKDKNQGTILEARNEQDQLLASMLLLWDDLSAYCLVLGMDERNQEQHAVKLLLWESIKEAANHVHEYNFEGSMIKNVERIFRSYGGLRTAYYNISWYRNNWIKAGMILLKK